MDRPAVLQRPIPISRFTPSMIRFFRYGRVTAEDTAALCAAAETFRCIAGLPIV